MERPSATEQEIGRKLAQVLDTAPVSARAQARLSQARQQALARAAHLQRRPVLVSRLAGLQVWFSDQWHAHPAAWGAGLAFAVMLSVGGWWQMQVDVASPDHALDVQLLADEAPLDTFTDARFEKWQTPNTLRD